MAGEVIVDKVQGMSASPAGQAELAHKTLQDEITMYLDFATGCAMGAAGFYLTRGAGQVGREMLQSAWLRIRRWAGELEITPAEPAEQQLPSAAAVLPAATPPVAAEIGTVVHVNFTNHDHAA